MKSLRIGVYSQKNNSLKPSVHRELIKRTNDHNTYTKNFQNYDFKTIHPENKKRRFGKKFVISSLVIFFVLIGFGYFRLQAINSRVEKYDEEGNKITACSNILNPQCWTEAFRPQLKQTDGLTNALIIGLDTRENSGSLKNTDSIIIISFNHETQKIVVISIPRDFYSYEYHTKINAVYAFTYNRNKDDEFYYLKESITKILNLPIHYVATVRFSGVIDLVNNIDGIEVCPQDAVTTNYPNDDPVTNRSKPWLQYSFTKGCQEVDGEKALVYARFRYVRKGPSYYASDFSRARRQQEVIGKIKDKILSQEQTIGERAENVWSLYQSLSKNITLDITFEDVLATISYLETADKSPINIVLDPTLGGLNRLIKSENTPATGYIIKSLDKSYKSIQAEIAQIIEFADFYREQPSILVRNQTGANVLPNDHIVLKLRNDSRYYNSFNILNEKKSDKIFDINVFDFTAGAKPLSQGYIKKFLGIAETDTTAVVHLPETYGITRSNKNEDFLIVVGPVAPTPTINPTTYPE